MTSYWCRLESGWDIGVRSSSGIFGGVVGGMFMLGREGRWGGGEGEVGWGGGVLLVRRSTSCFLDV